MEREKLSFCRICAAACGIVVTVDGEQVRRVRGDADHPVSSGYTCSKGRGLPEWHHSRHRLDAPRVRGAEQSWSATFGNLGSGLAAILGDHGAHAIGLYLATGLAYDAAGQVAAAQWLRTLGSRSFYTAVTVDNAPVLVAAELVTGHPMLNPVWDPGRPGLLLALGTNPVVSHGYGTALADPIRHLRSYQRAGGRVWVLDPRRSETAALADEHLAVRPGSDVAVLGAIANALLQDGADAYELAQHCDAAAVRELRAALAPFTIDRAAHASRVAAGEIARLVDVVRANTGRVAIMCGTGVTMGRDGVLAEWLRWVVLIVSGSLDREGGMRFHRGAINRLRAPKPAHETAPTTGPASRPELPRVVGQLPAAAMVDEIEAGNLRALVVTGGNPITAFPEPDRVRAALRSLEVLAVVDVLESELTQIATHVLPATGQLERADLTLAELTAVRSGLQSTHAVVAPVGERKPVWWMLAMLGRSMGFETLGGIDPDEFTDEQFLAGLLAHSPLKPEEVFASGPRGIDVACEYGWVRETLLERGRWNVAPRVMVDRLATHQDPEPGLVLVPRREMGWSNSVRYGAGTPEPLARMHSADALAAGASDGQAISLTTEHGELTTTVAVDDRVARGVVSMTHGRTGQSPGALTSATHDIDPLTTMPQASGVPVIVTPSTRPSDRRPTPDPLAPTGRRTTGESAPGAAPPHAPLDGSEPEPAP